MLEKTQLGAASVEAPVGRPDRFKDQPRNCRVLTRPNELMTFARNSEHALRSR